MDHEEWNKRYADQAFVWTVEPNQFLVAQTNDLRPGRALDLASGEGRNAVWLARQGWRVTAVDFSQAALAKARQLAKMHHVAVRWVLADVTHYRPRRGFYDFVLICYLHVPESDRHRVLTQARAAVAWQGTLLYIGHDLSNLERGHGGPRDPAVLCTPQDIVSALPGFQILKASVAAREIALEPAHGGPSRGIAFDTLVRARRLRRATGG